MEFVTASQIGKRLGLSVATAWRYARKGRFGQPVDPGAKHWKFADDEVLSFMLANCRHPRRTLWQEGASGHKRRLARFADGSRSTDSEDREMAAGLLMIAARRHERRAAGRSSPATTCSEAVVRELMRRKHAGDPVVLQILLETARQLSGNTTSPP
jgi:predicted DNA-binding transcriptional regulator AlpA